MVTIRNEFYLFDLGNFSLSNIQFGYEDDYSERLIELNNEEQYWYQDALQTHVLAIANGATIIIKGRRFVIVVSQYHENISPKISGFIFYICVLTAIAQSDMLKPKNNLYNIKL